MKLKLSIELHLPGKLKPLYARSERLDAGSFGKLAQELVEAAERKMPQEVPPAVLEHLSWIPPQWTDDFLSSL